MFEAQSDNGRYASLHLLVYRPPAMGGRVPVVRQQLGSYSRDGIVPGDTPWAGSAATGAAVVLVNFLYLAGKLDMVNTLFPGGPGFNVNDVIAFGEPVIAA